MLALSGKRSSKYIAYSHFICTSRHFSKIIIPLRCHIPLDAIPKSIQKKMNRAEKYLNSLGVRIKKIQLPSIHESETHVIEDNGSQKKLKEPLMDQSNALIVGSIHQYPQITHYNQSIILQIFGKNRLHKNSWSFDSKIQENYNIPLSTAIDYYPFKRTFSGDKSSKKHSKWKIRRKGFNIARRDSFNDKLPLLTREYNKDTKDEQQLVIYRDVAYDINSSISISPIIREYDPDIIIFEYGRLPFFDKYLERRFSFSNIMMPIKKILALLTPFKGLQIGIGKMLYGISKKIYKTEISSYGFESALDFVYKESHKRNNKQIAVVAADMHHKITDTLRVFNDYLDLYNIATLSHYGIIDAKFVKASTRTKLGDTLANIIQMRLYPHMTSMNVYRNDILSCVINEIDGEKYGKILLVSQAMRLNDLYDKLCGKSVINEWIKNMDGDHILMKKLNAYQYKVGSTNRNNTYLQNVIQSEFEEEILKCRSHLGDEQTAFLLMEYPLNEMFNDNKQEVLVNIKGDDLKEKEFVDKLKQTISETAQQLKLQNS